MDLQDNRRPRAAVGREGVNRDEAWLQGPECLCMGPLRLQDRAKGGEKRRTGCESHFGVKIQGFQEFFYSKLTLGRYISQDTRTESILTFITLNYNFETLRFMICIDLHLP